MLHLKSAVSGGLAISNPAHEDVGRLGVYSILFHCVFLIVCMVGCGARVEEPPEVDLVEISPSEVANICLAVLSDRVHECPDCRCLVVSESSPNTHHDAADKEKEWALKEVSDKLILRRLARANESGTRFDFEGRLREYRVIEKSEIDEVLDKNSRREVIENAGIIVGCSQAALSTDRLSCAIYSGAMGARDAASGALYILRRSDVNQAE